VVERIKRRHKANKGLFRAFLRQPFLFIRIEKLKAKKPSAGQSDCGRLNFFTLQTKKACSHLTHEQAIFKPFSKSLIRAKY
jgi:hypothetical protein